MSTALIVATAGAAYADPVPNPIGDLLNMGRDALLSVASAIISFPLISLIDALCASVNNFIVMLVDGSVLTQPFDSMLGAKLGNGMTVYQVASDLCNVSVKPLAYSILGLVIMVQVIKIAQRMDQHGTMPAVKDILFLAIFVTIFMFLIRHAQDLCAMVYTEIQKIVLAIQKPMAYSIKLEPWYGSDVISGVPIPGAAIGMDPVTGTLIFGVMVMAIVLLAVLIAWVVTLVMGLARALQLYLFMAFAPIPFALMGIDETRQMGVGFVKNFVSVCLAGAIMMFLLFCFPLILSAFFHSGGLVKGQGQILQLIALCILLIMGITKSGSWARDVLGG
jgi:hypothetical protein